MRKSASASLLCPSSDRQTGEQEEEEWLCDRGVGDGSDNEAEKKRERSNSAECLSRLAVDDTMPSKGRTAATIIARESAAPEAMDSVRSPADASVRSRSTAEPAHSRLRRQQQRQTRKLLKKRFTRKTHAYAVPPNSYFTPAAAFSTDGNVDRDEVEGGPRAGASQRREQRGGGTCHRHPPRRLAGRLIEQQRYNLPPCPPYRIPLYDQACFKYIFPNLFKNAKRKGKFEVMQLLFLCQMFILAIFNIIMTMVNVFFNNPADSILPWAEDLTVVVFSLEFAVVALLFLFMLVLVAHAIVVNRQGRANDVRRWKQEKEAKAKELAQKRATPSSSFPTASPMQAAAEPFTATLATPYVHRRKNGLVIGTTELAQDFAVLITLIGTFSVLRVVGLASPSFAFRRILPVFQNAATLPDIFKGIAFVLMWLATCLLAFVIVIAKVTQISFAFTASIGDWTVVNYIQLAGLLFNLARVDDSYYKETSVLLDAVHQHYSPPGEVKEYFSTWSAAPLATQDGRGQKGVVDDGGYDHQLSSLRAAAGRYAEEGRRRARGGSTTSSAGRHIDDGVAGRCGAGDEEGGEGRGNTTTIPIPIPIRNNDSGGAVAALSVLAEAEVQVHQSVSESNTRRRHHTHGAAATGADRGDSEARDRVGEEPIVHAATAGTLRDPAAKGTKEKERRWGEEKWARQQRRRRSWKEEVVAQARLADSPSLLTRIMKLLHVPPFMYFTYFDVIYDYHFNAYQQESEKAKAAAQEKKALEKELAADGKTRKRTEQQIREAREKRAERMAEEEEEDSGPPQLPARTHVYNFFNYLSFIFEIDNVQLRRYLQMIHSPLPFYRTGRDAFVAAFVERDLVCMDMSLWRSDPTLRATQRYARVHPGQFNIAYTCEDRRDVWDERYTEWAQLQEMHNAISMAKDVANGVMDIVDSDGC